MIITIGSIILMIVGIILIHLYYHSTSIDEDVLDNLCYLGFALGVINALITISCAILIIVSDCTADRTIQKNRMEYEALLKRYEIINSEYEDVSKSDVIKDIAEWNIKVYNTKYWTNSLWTNWFNPQEIADNMEYIVWEEKK